jgi:hypothetical protein
MIREHGSTESTAAFYVVTSAGDLIACRSVADMPRGSRFAEHADLVEKLDAAQALGVELDNATLGAALASRPTLEDPAPLAPAQEQPHVADPPVGHDGPSPS